MKQLLSHLVHGGTLSVEEAVQAFELIMTGQATPAQVGALLALLQTRQPTIEEITGAALVMRAKVTPVAAPAGLTVIDTCGTGGAQSPAFNISTAAALVAAGAGRPRKVVVAKHGNRAVTSRTGSAQVLEALGVKLKCSGETQTRCLDEAGVCFCFAPAHHPAMKFAAPIRADLGFRTIFNVLGPLTNPAGAKRQLLGVYRAELTSELAQVLCRLGADEAMVVFGHFVSDSLEATPGFGLGEMSITGPTRISHLRGGSVSTYTLDATTLGLPRGDAAALYVDGPAASAAIIRRVLAGEKGPCRDVVCLNAAAALVVAGLTPEMAEGLRLAQEAIDSGAAAKALEKLVAITQADMTA